MQNDLIWIIDRDFQVKVDIEARVHKRVFCSGVHILVRWLNLAVRSHDDFMAIGVNMVLAQGNRFGEHIEACTEKVDVKHFVVLDKAEDALVVVSCALRAESDNNPLASVGLNDTFSHRDRE